MKSITINGTTYNYIYESDEDGVYVRIGDGKPIYATVSDLEERWGKGFDVEKITEAQWNEVEAELKQKAISALMMAGEKITPSTTGTTERKHTMKFEKYTVIVNGKKEIKSYEEICRDLGIIASVHFVKPTTACTISFSVGKPDEIKYLLSACRERGYKPSKKLIDAANA